MSKKIVLLICITIVMMLFFAGCNEQTGTISDKNNNNDKDVDFGVVESFNLDFNGGSFSLFDEDVQFNFDYNSVFKEVEITVEKISDPVKEDSIDMFEIYEFGPDGMVFDRPVELIISYDLDDISEGVNEQDLRIFVLNGDKWEEIEGSFTNIFMHWAVAEVSHFSKMGCGAYTPSNNDMDGDNDDDSSDEDDGSAQYWFKADFYYYDYVNPRYVDWLDQSDYNIGVSAYWDPVPYVHYYQLKFVYNGNNPTPYAWSCDYRKQSKNYCNEFDYPFKENYIYQLGGDANTEGFVSVLKDGDATMSYVDEDTGENKEVVVARLWPEGKHGYNFLGVHDTVRDDEEFSDIQIGSLVGNMQTFVKAYTNNWEIWVRGVTQTQS